MSATDDLRRMLDERAIEWESPRPGVTWFYDKRGNSCESANWCEESVTLCLYDLTPAEALDAALGRGECRLSGYTDAAFRVVQASGQLDFIDYAEVCECSACGASFIVPHEYERIASGEDELWPKFNFCPNCGRKVVDE